MPITGVIAGYVTNWLALEMIFKPLEPKKFLFFYYQGLFLKRQSDVSWELAEILDKRVFHAKNFIRLFFEGKAKETFIELLIQEIKKAYEDIIRENALFISFTFSLEQKE